MYQQVVIAHIRLHHVPLQSPKLTHIILQAFSDHPIYSCDVSVHTRERVKRERSAEEGWLVKRIKEQKRVVCVHGQYF